MRPTGWALVGATVLFSGQALGVGWGTSPVDIPLGEGASAHREPVRCFNVYAYRPGCTMWHLTGVEAPTGPYAFQVHMYALGPAGRIFAAVDSGVLYTDDRGAHWSRASWDGAQSPRSLAFDTATGFGAAVGTFGTVWTTTDGGANWRTRRDDGDLFVDVAVLGRVVAWTSAVGVVQVSADGGTSVRTISERSRGPLPVMVTYQGNIWIRVESGRWWRVDRDGAAERAERSPWGD